MGKISAGVGGRKNALKAYVQIKSIISHVKGNRKKKGTREDMDLVERTSGCLILIVGVFLIDVFYIMFLK